MGGPIGGQSKLRWPIMLRPYCLQAWLREAWRDASSLFFIQWIELMEYSGGVHHSRMCVINKAQDFATKGQL